MSISTCLYTHFRGVEASRGLARVYAWCQDYGEVGFGFGLSQSLLRYQQLIEILCFIKR